MHAILSFGLGYFMGCLNPAVWVGNKKNINLKESGTGNLGATNATLVLGRKAGVFVLFFDILKSLFAARAARAIFRHLPYAGYLAAIGAIAGHCFPVFMKFQGGKGLAAFGGMILYYNPWAFLIIITSGILMMTLFNTGVAAPMTGVLLFPILVWWGTGSVMDTGFALAASILIFFTHWSNLVKAFTKNDVISTKRFYKDILFRKRRK